MNQRRNDRVAPLIWRTGLGSRGRIQTISSNPCRQSKIRHDVRDPTGLRGEMKILFNPTLYVAVSSHDRIPM
jgi:hypothetical protein